MRTLSMPVTGRALSPSAKQHGPRRYAPSLLLRMLALVAACVFAMLLAGDQLHASRAAPAEQPLKPRDPEGPGGGGGPPTVGVAIIAVGSQNTRPESVAVDNFVKTVLAWHGAPVARGNGRHTATLRVDLYLVYPSGTNVRPLDFGPRVRVLEPCAGHEVKLGCKKQGALSDLVNYAAKLAPEDADFVMTASLSHTLGSDALQQMVEPLLAQESVGATGCTITQMDGPNPRVLEHGVAVGNGWEDAEWKIFLLKQFSGFPVVDHRVSGTSSVAAVSPHCMLTRSALLSGLGGFRKLSTSVFEQMAVGLLPPDFHAQQLTYLKKKLVVLSALYVKYQPADADKVWEKRVRQSAAATMEQSLQLIDRLEGAAFDPTDADLQGVDFGPLEEGGGGGRRFEGLLADLRRFTDRIQQLQSSQGVSGAAEESGWDYCLRLKQRGLSVLVVPAAAMLQADLMPPALLTPANARAGWSHASLVVDGTFGDVWGPYLRKYWPGSAGGDDEQLAATGAPATRIIWQSFCCHCCGFSNEILHLVFPLQRKHAVDLIPAPDCFCQGYPSAVLDSLARMHLPPSLVEQPVNHDEIVIWISHTDPGSYLTGTLERKKPTYVVGRSMYEFTKIPARWVGECKDNADEIWVPSSFVRDVWVDNGVDANKVILIPEAIDVYFFDPDVAGKVPVGPFRPKWKVYDSNPRRATAKTFKFLSHFKWEDRKGWDVLYQAYFSSYTATDMVTLIVLTHIWFPGPPETHGDVTNHTYVREEVLKLAREKLKRAPESLPHFVIITSRLAEEDVAALYNSVDAFILPTRGEGWGLPPLQAMSMGLPTATTNWSGSVDFLSPKYSFPIPIDRLEELARDSYYGWEPGKLWAVPSLEETCRIMKYMTDPTNAVRLKEMGRIARQEVVQRYSEEAVADIVSNRLQAIKKLILEGAIPPRKPKEWG